jgi:sugar phosphate isomerase/epimerase
MLKIRHIIWFATVLLTGCREAEVREDFRLGFTTQNFAGHVPVSVETAKEFVTYARDQGLQWIELRDPDASLTAEACRDIAALARELGVEVNYSAQRGLLAEDFWEIFDRAVVNTAVFDGPRTVRVLALRGEGEKGWTEQEFRHMVAVANQAVRRATEHGVGFTVENADAALDGRDRPYYGMIELMEEMASEVTLQLDTANLFTGPVPVTPEEAEAFIKRYAPRISYLHLKSARDGQALPVLDGNPLDFKTIFSILADHGPQYIAIELAPNKSAEQVFANMESGVNSLRREGLLR